MNLTPAALAAFAKGDMENFLTAATPGGIEAQEAAGQVTFCAQATLPKDMMGCTRADFEAMGFKFGADADDLFVSVTMPAGWKKKATDHSMWSDLVDEKGRTRAQMFYKAAFYDRKAHVNLVPRFSIGRYEGSTESGERVDERAAPADHWRVTVKDGENVIHLAGTCKARDYDAQDKLDEKAVAWLKERYPDYENKRAYWD